MTPVPKQTKDEKTIGLSVGRTPVGTSVVGAILTVAMIVGMISCTSCQKNDVDPNILKTGDVGIAEQSDVNVVENNNKDYSVSKSDEELLISFVASEATDATSEEMAAIASVVLNRVKHSGRYTFPDTVYDVIYQPGQFYSAGEGKIMPIDLVKTDEELYSRAVTAVQDAKRYDSTNGSMFFLKVSEAKYLFPNGNVIGEYMFSSEYPEGWP